MNLSAFQKLESEPNVDLYFQSRISSTQEILKQVYKNQGFIKDTALLAEYQEQGQGRDGRTWVELSHPQILCSYLLRLHIESTFISQLPTLSLIAGLSIAKQLNLEFAQHVQLKWPNDLMLDGKKVGGILIDLLRSQDSFYDFLVGFGLNTTATPSDWPQDLHNKATAMSTHSLTLDQRVKLTFQILSELQANFQTFGRQGFDPFLKNIQKCSFLTQKTISLKTLHGLVRGKVLGISSIGELLIEKADQSVSSHISGHVLSFE